MLFHISHFMSLFCVCIATQSVIAEASWEGCGCGGGGSVQIKLAVWLMSYTRDKAFIFYLSFCISLSCIFLKLQAQTLGARVHGCSQLIFGDQMPKCNPGTAHLRENKLEQGEYIVNGRHTFSTGGAEVAFTNDQSSWCNGSNYFVLYSGKGPHFPGLSFITRHHHTFPAIVEKQSINRVSLARRLTVPS